MFQFPETFLDIVAVSNVPQTVFTAIQNVNGAVVCFIEARVPGTGSDAFSGGFRLSLRDPLVQNFNYFTWVNETSKPLCMVPVPPGVALELLTFNSLNVKIGVIFL